MIRRWLPLAALAACCLGAAACDTRAPPPLRLDVALSPTPPMAGPARILVSAVDSAGTGVDGLEVRLSIAPTGAASPGWSGVADALGEGRYAADAVPFDEAGPWMITTRATLPDGRVVTLERQTRVVGAPPPP